MNKSTLSKKMPFLVVQLVIVLIIAGLAGFIGYTIAVHPFKKLADHYDKFRTLGSLLKEKDVSPGLSDLQRNEYYQAYSAKEKIIPQADRITWMVPNTLTPFVVVGPTPGTHDNTHINRMQFRSMEELTFPKPAREFRIFITGGSTAFSSGAPDQDHTISALLEKKLNDARGENVLLEFKVYTMANPAWATTHERIIIENRLSELEPDLVISLSGNNDVHWGGVGRNILWFRTYIDEFFLLLINRARKLAGRDEDPEIINVSQKPVHPQLVAQRLAKNVRLSAYVLSLKNTPYVFFLQPTLAMTKKMLTPREKEFLRNKAYFTLCYRQIHLLLQQIKEENFYFVNLSACFDDMGDPAKHEDIFLDSFHFGDKGNKIIADKMFRHLQQLFGKQWQTGF